MSLLTGSGTELSGGVAGWWRGSLPSLAKELASEAAN
jgi:hypothetical protein